MQLKTVGEGHFDVHFNDQGKNGKPFGFQCGLKNSTQAVKFKLHLCTKGAKDCCEMKGMPRSGTRVWTFSVSDTTLKLECEGNGVRNTVMSVTQSKLKNCVTKDEWKNLLTKFQIWKDDDVTKEYRINCKTFYFKPITILSSLPMFVPTFNFTILSLFIISVPQL